MSTKPIMVKGRMVGFIQTYVPDGWGTPEFDAKFPPVIGESYLQRIRREYDPEDKAMQPAHKSQDMQCAPIEIIATVRGDCGIIHAGIKEWQDCAACDAILKYRLRVRRG